MSDRNGSLPRQPQRVARAHSTIAMTGTPKVLLGQSYYLRFDAKLWEAMQPYPPLGSLYAASLLRQRGYDVAFFDAMLAASEAEWAQALAVEAPHFAILYEDNFNYLSKMCLLRMRQAAFTMIKMARVQSAPEDCTIIVCGADASDHPAMYLDNGADYVIVGEGEETLVELMDRLTGQSSIPLDSIMGLAFSTRRLRQDEEVEVKGEQRAVVDSNGKKEGSTSALVRTARRPDITDLDALPFPAWDLVDISRYQEIWYQHHGYYSMNLVTTRGCPYHCNWCAKPIWGQRYNVRSPENTVAEMKWLQQRFHPDHIWFVDDIIGLKPGWLARFADLVEAEFIDGQASTGQAIPFKCLNRADLLLRGDTIDALRRAGCQTVWIGAESGSQKVLDAMEKGIRVEQIIEASQRLHAAGIHVGLFLQFGYPGEDRQDIARTLQMVRACRPDDIGISVSYPLPGTKFYERVKNQLGLRQNWLDSNDMAMLYTGPYTTTFYRQLHRVVHKEFRARHTWHRLLAHIKQPTQLTRHDLRQAAAMLYHIVTLPLARRRLDALAKLPHSSAFNFPAALDRKAAATPTPQHE